MEIAQMFGKAFFFLPCYCAVTVFVKLEFWGLFRLFRTFLTFLGTFPTLPVAYTTIVGGPGTRTFGERAGRPGRNSTPVWRPLSTNENGGANRSAPLAG